MKPDVTLQMAIRGLMIDPVSSMPIVILKDESGESVLPIWVGIFEANAIATQLEEIASPRPMTHDLLRSMIETLGAEVRRVVITDLKDNTFFAVIQLERAGETLSVDARPSDAMALALRVKAPIFVERQVLAKSEKTEDGKSAEAERLRRWLETVDPEELGNYEM
jgi:bifunctional DNase/RNase